VPKVLINKIIDVIEVIKIVYELKELKYRIE